MRLFIVSIFGRFSNWWPRCDERCLQLQPPHESPFRVLMRGSHDILGELWSNKECVSVDRLKPVHVFPDDPVEVPQPPWFGHPPDPTPTFPVPSTHSWFILCERADPPGSVEVCSEGWGENDWGSKKCLHRESVPLLTPVGTPVPRDPSREWGPNASSLGQTARPGEP